MNELLTLSEAAKAIPGKPSLVTLWRWVHKGVKNGARLRAIRIGGRRYIPRDAIAEFIEACSAIDVAEPAKRPTRTDKERAAAIKRAEAILDGK